MARFLDAGGGCGGWGRKSPRGPASQDADNPVTSGKVVGIVFPGRVWSGNGFCCWKPVDRNLFQGHPLWPSACAKLCRETGERERGKANVVLTQTI